MTINSALALKVDGTDAVKAYMDGNVVWPTGSATVLSVSIAKVANQAKVTVSTAVSGLDPDTYRYYLSENNGAWTYKYEGGPGPHTFNVGYSKSYRAKVEAFKSGLLIKTAYSGSVTTDAAPPPPTQQKVATLSRAEFASYNGSGTQRTDSDGLTHGYSGYVSSTHGNQRCSFRFNIPSDVRWCKSIDKVEMSAYNLWAYYNNGRTVRMALHHYGDLTSTSYGSTGVFAEYSAGKPGWVGGAEWINITNYTCPGRYKVWDEFRRFGATGLHFHQGPSNSYNYYGYVRNDVRLRITYTVYT